MDLVDSHCPTRTTRSDLTVGHSNSQHEVYRTLHIKRAKFMSYWSAFPGTNAMTTNDVASSFRERLLVPHAFSIVAGRMTGTVAENNSDDIDRKLQLILKSVNNLSDSRSEIGARIGRSRWGDQSGHRFDCRNWPGQVDRIMTVQHFQSGRVDIWGHPKVELVQLE